MVKHEFTVIIIRQIEQELQASGEELIKFAPLLEYINIKTRSANKGSKSRGSFANLYAIYILLENYIKIVFDEHKNYSEYEGAVFSELFKRQRKLPFGAKLQNHALNHRLNEKFHKYFPMRRCKILGNKMKIRSVSARPCGAGLRKTAVGLAPFVRFFPLHFFYQNILYALRKGLESNLETL